MRRVAGFLSEAERDYLRIRASSAGWEPGRQGTGYLRAAVPGPVVGAIADRALAEMGAGPDVGRDAYLLRYPAGTHVPRHVDDAPFGQEHHRLNALVAEGVGGRLIVAGVHVPLAPGDACVFRPDAEAHEVTGVESGERLVLTVGALLAPDRGDFAVVLLDGPSPEAEYGRFKAALHAYDPGAVPLTARAGAFGVVAVRASRRALAALLRDGDIDGFEDNAVGVVPP